MTGHIFVYGEIGTGTGQVSQKFVKSQIDKSAEKYIVHIFSPGGDVFEGYGIYNAIKNDTAGKPVEVHIEGLCASIATLVAASGQRIVMNKTGQFMIHNPHITDLKGDANKLRSVANQLDQIKSILINVYKIKTGLTVEKLWELYDNETYLTADQAEELGFIDESVDAIKAVAKLDLNNFNMEKKKPTFWAALKSLLNTIKNEAATLADGTVIEVLTEDGEWVGKQVMTADGNALASGEHPLVDGRVLVVGDGGIISEVRQAEAPADKQQNEEMDNKIKELETQLAEAKAAKEAALATAEAAKSEAASANAKVSKFENKMTDLEKQFLELKEAASKTIGDKTPPPAGPSFKNLNQQGVDPLDAYMYQYHRNRNLIAND